MGRARADAVLAARGLFPSAAQARAAILAGEVRVAGVRVAKAGEIVDEDAEFEIAEHPRFVSRGGLKLAGALDAFGTDVTGLRCVDVGASTGGFTDCLLSRGAASVCAVDVGYGQLAWELRNDPRVAVFERTNIRQADPAALGAPFDLAVVDVSFIALAKVLPQVLALVSGGGAGERDGQMLGLVKPQFEIGKGRVGKRGVVSDPGAHTEVLESVDAAVAELGWVVTGRTFSPVKGPEGNIEFWVRVQLEGPAPDATAAEVVAEAHETLG
ncbi:MAG: TlyA family RNA methyltransferase [Actinobacteria bacterium]|nr:MAG: TlyA family RNA methyltransferase [Actinomycetota bacterium]